MTVDRRLAGELGTASLEFVALLPYLLLAAAFAWQVLVGAAFATSAENAARTGSRAAAVGRDGAEEAIAALSPGFRQGARAEVGEGPGCDDDQPDRGTRVAVCVEVPALWPGLGFPLVTITRSAELPPS